MVARYTINRKIQKFVKDNDKKVGAVADKAGIRRDVFSRIINCRRPIYAEELVPILNALGMPLDGVIKEMKEEM